jgi:hypothetical protein
MADDSEQFEEEKNHHPFELISDGDRSAEVDEEIAPLVLELWKANIDTSSCCQDAGEALADLPTHFPHLRSRVESDLGRAYIDFPSPEDACLFMEAVANSGPRDAFYERMVHWCSPGAWSKTISLDDWGIEEGEELAPDGTRLSRFEPHLVQISFPRSDIPEIIERLRRFHTGETPALGEPTWLTVSLSTTAKHPED